MQSTEKFVDLHCHLVPGMDDGARSWAESLHMARMAVADGTGTIVVTPHQLGSFSHIGGEEIRRATCELQKFLETRGLNLTVLPGADVRVQTDLAEQLQGGSVLTLADHGRHVLLELPHELCFSIETCLDRLDEASITGILSHPERNQGLLRRPDAVGQLVERGCLMQVTAGSLLGTFGPRCQAMAERLLRSGWVHFIASDAHGAKARRPLLQPAFRRVAQLVGQTAAYELCCRNPALVARGYAVPTKVSVPPLSKRSWFANVLRRGFPPRRAA